MSRIGSWQIAVAISTREVRAAMATANCSGEGTRRMFRR
jgi:hypothetical protein